LHILLTINSFEVTFFINN